MTFRSVYFPVREFPKDQDQQDSVLLGPFPVFGNDPGAQTIGELLRTQSSRVTWTVSLTAGKTTVTMSAANALGLAAALLEHIDHLGEKGQVVMVEEGRTEKP